MQTRNIYVVSFVILLALQVQTVSALAQGDKVFAQLADGIATDGSQFVTKFRITNLGASPTTEIKQLKIMFFHQNGDPWAISTNLGTASELPMDVGAYQTVAIETSGTSALSSGYAIVRNSETATIYAQDYQVAVTAFYEIRKGGSVLDTVSIPASDPTLSFVVPVEMDAANNLYTGFAVVNLAGSSNAIRLQLFGSSSNVAAPAQDSGSATVTLKPAEQTATYLYPSIFPVASSFKGMLVGKSDGPVAVAGLLQSPFPDGVQYAVMAPAYLDALRRDSQIYLRLGYSLDADRCISDYWWDQNLINDPNYFEPDATLPWDLLLEKQSSTTRRLSPRGNAQIAVIGPRTGAQFDSLTIASLQALAYSANPIDMSDGSPNLAMDPNLGNFAFAIKTGLGRYVKVRVNNVVSRGTDKDLALEIFVYK